MGKSNKTVKSSTALPRTPLLYINDPQLNTPSITAISTVIPSTKIFHPSNGDGALFNSHRSDVSKETVFIVASHSTDEDHPHKAALATHYKDVAIKQGRNFASVNLYSRTGTPSAKLKDWGPNHLDLKIAKLYPAETADEVYKWLFTVLSVPETIHLIPHSELGELATNTRHCPEHYTYCPLGESRGRPKDAKIQFVALITSKPTVTPGKLNPKTGEVEGSKLIWTVADKSGIATFFYQHRGPSSQPTWDWVLALKPGERRALPRNPSVAVTEPTSTRVVKAPVRLIGETVSATGAVMQGIGYGLTRVGEKLKMGKGKQWVAEADVRGKAVYKDDVKGRRVGSLAEEDEEKSEKREIWHECVEPKRDVQVFDDKNDKGRQLWGDEDSLASTVEGGSVVDGKESARVSVSHTVLPQYSPRVCG